MCVKKNRMFFHKVLRVKSILGYAFSLVYKYLAFNNSFQKPTVINFNAIEICNSHCKMCNIWKNANEPEITPNQIAAALQSKLFSEVTHIGITGGEPTLRADLENVVESCIENLPSLKSLSMITNCIDFGRVIEAIQKVQCICKQRNIAFSVMLSLDGIEGVHDNQRGTPGNFSAFEQVLSFLKSQSEIPFSIGVTITKLNVWHVDEILDYAKSKQVYARFRVAEFIQRLNNLENTEWIRNFSKDEAYHLALFFFKLETFFEPDPTIRRTYKSIRTMLLGGQRQIGCPYQRNGIVLNGRGEIAYCAPKGKILGNAIVKDAFLLYKENQKQKKDLFKHCPNCIHDYHFEETLPEFVSRAFEVIFRRLIRIESFSSMAKLYPLLWMSSCFYRIPKNSALIVGWYGTETIGDKAILAGIVNTIRNTNKETKIYVASIYPFITARTVQELGLPCEVVPTYGPLFIALTQKAGQVIMGGGPLMHIDELAIPLIGFYLAKKHRNKTLIWSCGIGPVKTPKHLQATKQILSLSDEIYLRDQASVSLAKSWLPNKEIHFRSDPAVSFLKHRSHPTDSHSPGIEIACYLREFTKEYSSEESEESFSMAKKKFESGLAHFIREKAVERNCKRIHFYHMHNFAIGNDDRDFSRYFLRNYSDYFRGFEILVDARISTVSSIIESMQRSKMNLCMRFHAVLFANELATDFIALDYTAGGKIRNYLSDNGKLDHLVSFDDITNRETC